MGIDWKGLTSPVRRPRGCEIISLQQCFPTDQDDTSTAMSGFCVNLNCILKRQGAGAIISSASGDEAVRYVRTWLPRVEGIYPKNEVITSTMTPLREVFSSAYWSPK